MSEEISLRYILLMIVTELTRKLKSDLTRKAKVITNRVLNFKKCQTAHKTFRRTIFLSCMETVMSQYCTCKNIQSQVVITNVADKLVPGPLSFLSVTHTGVMWDSHATLFHSWYLSIIWHDSLEHMISEFYSQPYCGKLARHWSHHINKNSFSAIWK